MRVLLVDGSPEAFAALSALEDAGMEVRHEPDGEAGLDRALAGDFDALVTELRLNGVGGLKLVAELRERRPRLPVIVLSAEASGDVAIRAVRHGAFDVLSKPLDTSELVHVVEDAVATVRRSSKPVDIGGERAGPEQMIGRSRAMTRVYRELAKLASTPVTVLIRGETGTGKELVARALYQHGHRAHKPFVAVNCAAIPEPLLESELFGHEKGAFTGAHVSRIGRFEQAHNATLFMDEIGDMNLTLQSKLLRVLQEKSIQRVGGREDIPVDVRFIAATHRNLEQMVERGEFREDLYYRLNVAGITLPPLRERAGDLPLLIDYFLNRAVEEMAAAGTGISQEAVEWMALQAWPGNVRQLQNVIRKAVVRRRGYTIGLDDVRECMREPGPADGHAGDPGLRELAREALGRAIDGEIPSAYAELHRRMERELLSTAMELSGGNKARAARWLGIARMTLREKLQQLGIES